MLRTLVLTLAAIATTAFSTDEEGFTPIFNGKDFTGWKGPVENYEVKDGTIACKAGKGGTIYTAEEYADFVVRLEVMIPAGSNNGLAIRYPGSGDTVACVSCRCSTMMRRSMPSSIRASITALPMAWWPQSVVT
jgi:hypothetical protein